MKIILLLLFIFPSGLPAQRISVDSLERNGYHVRIYKPEEKPKVQTIIKKERDTIYIPAIHIIILRDTILREQIYYYHIEQVHQGENLSAAEQQQLHTLLIGNANTNGYGMHIGIMLSLGDRISFFIGGGMGYNSVTKITHLDLAGQLVIRIW